MKQLIREYTLRIVPPNPIYEHVLGLKGKFRDIFGKYQYSSSKPHVTMALFRMETKYEERLVNIVTKLSKEKYFTVDILGINAFYNAHVLLLEIDNSKDISEFFHKTSALFNEELNDVVPKIFISKSPHMTISKVKNKAMLDDCLELFKKQPYSNSFIVKELILTSRRLNQTWDWELSIPLSE
ncbi:2'-5' RNA ligase family protein [Flavobacteriaceae bacterium SZ-1-7]|uniref:2'-5' RNA ligase family protein n=1 Tax=Tamlana sedimenti TaxID=3134126 RepID=UPI00312A293D